MWTTIVVKYRGVSERDFDIVSIAPGPFEPGLVLPGGYNQDSGEPIPADKIHAQRRETTRSLSTLVRHPEAGKPQWHRRRHRQKHCWRSQRLGASVIRTT